MISVIWTLIASAGPLFLTVIVQIIWSPLCAVVVDADFVMLMSAMPIMWVVLFAMLFFCHPRL